MTAFQKRQLMWLMIICGALVLLGAAGIALLFSVDSSEQEHDQLLKVTTTETWVTDSGQSCIRVVTSKGLTAAHCFAPGERMPTQKTFPVRATVMTLHGEPTTVLKFALLPPSDLTLPDGGEMPLQDGVEFE